MGYKSATAGIIRRLKSIDGTADDSTVDEAKEQDDNELLGAIVEYARPEPPAPPTPEDIHRANTNHISYMRDEIRTLNDRIRRLKEQIGWEIQFWESALNEGKKETREQVKRRVSRLKGSLEYLGRPDYYEQER
jgi:hypothetical protein